MIAASFPLIRAQRLNATATSFTIRCPEVARAAEPGQFVQVKVPGRTLCRPISICEISDETLRLVFDIRGKGTAEMAAWRAGDTIDLIAPLGNGFTPPSPGEKIIAVGGGIGVPPLLELCKRADCPEAILGFQTASAVLLLPDFAQVAHTTLCTDDGTAGLHGFTTQALRERLEKGSADRICACGPRPMLEGVARLAEEFGVPCELSLEQRMACGVGACLVCQCRLVRDGREFSAHVCKDGPVFDAKEVRFE